VVLFYSCLTGALLHPLIPFRNRNYIILKGFDLSEYTLSIEKKDVKEIKEGKIGEGNSDI